MKRTILEIYALAVCFVTVVCAVVALGIGIYDVLQIANPEFTLPAYEYSRHQSNDAFFRSGAGPMPPRGIEQGTPFTPPPELSEEEETRRRLASYEMVLQQERRSAKQSLVIVLIVLTIDATVFLVHWKLARRAREAMGGTT